jgi:hypothetical protein
MQSNDFTFLLFAFRLLSITYYQEYMILLNDISVCGLFVMIVFVEMPLFPDVAHTYTYMVIFWSDTFKLNAIYKYTAHTSGLDT